MRRLSPSCGRPPLVPAVPFFALYFLSLCLLQASFQSGDALRMSPDLIKKTSTAFSPRNGCVLARPTLPSCQIPAHLGFLDFFFSRKKYTPPGMKRHLNYQIKPQLSRSRLVCFFSPQRKKTHRRGLPDRLLPGHPHQHRPHAHGFGAHAVRRPVVADVDPLSAHMVLRRVARPRDGLSERPRLGLALSHLRFGRDRARANNRLQEPCYIAGIALLSPKHDWPSKLSNQNDQTKTDHPNWHTKLTTQVDQPCSAGATKHERAIGAGSRAMVKG